MRTVNDFPSKAGATAEIVVGGHKKHPDPDQGNKFQTTNPLTHGPNINPRDYPYTMILGQCTQAALETQDPPPEPGSCVIKLPVMGAPSSAVGIGVLKDKNMAGSSAGNMNNMSFPGIAQALTADVEKKLSKGYETKQEDGAEVRREKDGGNWNHNMTKGLPTHAALYPLAGTVLQARQQIETAIQQFGNILSSGAMAQMPGSFMSLDSLFNKMTKKQKKKATKKMPKETLQAFESMLGLMQNGDAGTSFVGGRVHEETFIENAIKLLENAKDFILFKSDLLLKDAAHDPIRKATVGREIVESISKIPDAIKRAVFLKESANILSMDESLLISEANKLRYSLS